LKITSMAQNSTIEWTESTWNPVTGCTKISSGCKNCYAERLALRLQAMGNRNYKNGFAVTMHHHALDIPLKWKKPKMVFVNSMSDLFHPEVSLDFIEKVFNVIEKTPQHTFQVLTKRSERLVEIQKELKWLDNLWLGVSIENEECSYRVNHLLKANARVKFISFEPLIGPVDFVKLEGIDWVIVGGESGPGARPMKQEWVDKIRIECLKKDIPFFFKQWGGFNKKKNGRLLNGKTWDEMPRIHAV